MRDRLEGRVVSHGQIRALCMSLMQADTENEVITILRDAGYWDDPACWRYYSDYENNYNSIGNQQSRPDAALVEKLINSIDARLVNECLGHGIDPEGPRAPRTIREAVARFFENARNPSLDLAGRIKYWSNEFRTEVAKGITLTSTGLSPGQGNPCFSIADCGEGQTPERMPDTFLSLVQSNKLRIPFVQGKFNMGGAGVLKFCGRHNLQLILSRRNPSIIDQSHAHPSDFQWGFTVVRREDPKGNRRNSVFTYLAPVEHENQARRGGVLRFTAPSMPIFPDGRDPYAKHSEWGTLIKLYEYSVGGFRTHILRKGGILGRLDLLLPDLALPIRLYECRSGYRGHSGSFETNLMGLGVRLDDDRGENLEKDFPTPAPFRVLGEPMTATIYAFKKGRSDTYRKNEGVIFTVNGQTHGHLTTDFFRRGKVGLSYLADSILVVVDCSEISGRAREDLFMNSRDRLRNGDLRSDTERSLEDILKHHPGLRALKERRRREEMESKLADSKPLEDVLELLLKRSPTLSLLFLAGKQLSSPLKTRKAQEQQAQFLGSRFPTFFKFKGKPYGIVLNRDCHVNMRARITFETDAVNDYFLRDEQQGEFNLEMISGGSSLPADNYSLNLHNGIATLSVQLPEQCQVGDHLEFQSTVRDSSRVFPFENRFVLNVKPALDSSGRAGSRRQPPGSERGTRRELPGGISLPTIIQVTEEKWNNYTPPFDQYTALRIIHAGTENGETENSDVYDFYVNIDNSFLKAEMKMAPHLADVLKAQFTYGLVLIGLAMIQEHFRTHQSARKAPSSDPEEKDEPYNVADTVETTCKAIAPVLIPMVESLGTLNLEEAAVASSGEID